MNNLNKTKINPIRTTTKFVRKISYTNPSTKSFKRNRYKQDKQPNPRDNSKTWLEIKDERFDG